MEAIIKRDQATPAGNVTADARAPAVAVPDPAIDEVLDLDSGEIHNVRALVNGFSYGDFVRKRSEVEERLTSARPKFACPICGTSVSIRSSIHKRFFFRHRHEDGSCPAVTREGLTREEIQERKYHGLRESEAHKRIKALLARSLRADPAFSETLEETIWRSAENPDVFRRPDVHSIFSGIRHAFEIQLSTTFLDVVVGRRAFYRAEGGLLVWVFGRFSPDYRRLTTDDLLFPNNSNVFVVDEETTAVSEATGALHLRCHYRRPQRTGETIGDQWEHKLVCYHDLTRDLEGQRLFYFDFDRAEAQLLAEIRSDAETREGLARTDLREAFLAFWRALPSRTEPGSERVKMWWNLRDRLATIGISIPESPDDDMHLGALLNAMTSAEAGKPVRWEFNHLVEVGHKLDNNYKQHILAYGHAIEAFGRKPLLDDQDRKTGKWAKKRDRIRAAIRRREMSYRPDSASLPLLEFLYPVIGARVRAYLADPETASRATA